MIVSSFCIIGIFFGKDGLLRFGMGIVGLSVFFMSFLANKS
jgi:hypothetical protein